MLFLVAAVAISIAAGAWWMQRIAFTPDGTRESAAAVLEDADIRVELNTLIVSAAAPTMNVNPVELGSVLENVVLTTRPGAAEMAPIIERIHRRIIGDSDERVVLTGADMVPIVRDERAYDAQDVTMPIDQIGVLRNFDGALGWVWLVAGGLGALALVLGILARPDRRDVHRFLGEFGIGLAASMLVFGYLIPVHLLTALDNQTWSHAIPRVTSRTVPLVIGLAAVLAIGGGALLLYANVSSGRRQKTSTPLAAARYRGGDNPGWR
jgi:hypothetical protein